MARTAVLDRPGERTAAASAPEATEQRARWRLATLVVAFIVATVGTALGLRGHAMWFDELQAWNIARSAHSLGDLYGHLRYEGHPIVWYLPLFALTRVTGNPHTMQVLQWAIATATFALLLFRSPFSVPIRIMVVAGYFFAFEYGVITRSYGLSAFLAVLAAILLARPRPAWWPAAAVLVVMAWTSLPGAVLAVAYVAAVAVSSRARLRWSLAVGIAAVAAALSCVPPSDFSDSFAPGLAADASRFGTGIAIRAASATAGIWRGLVPIPASIGERNSNLLDGVSGAIWIEAALSLLLFLVILGALRPFPFARRLWWIGSLAYVGFFVAVIRPEQSRYAGFVFLLFLSCAWLAIAPPATNPPPPRPLIGDDRLSACSSHLSSPPRSSPRSRSTPPPPKRRSRATRDWRRQSTPHTSTTRSSPARTGTGPRSAVSSTGRSTRSPATNGSAPSRMTSARSTASSD